MSELIVTCTIAPLTKRDAVFKTGPVSGAKSGVFIASKKGVTGDVCDQAELLALYGDEMYQDAAFEAVSSFIIQ
jgi:hypothetical protein